jgi:hypothetical protein
MTEPIDPIRLIDPARLMLDITSASRTPVAEPLLIHLAVEGWDMTRLDEFSEAAIPEAGPYRASYAGKRCNRQLAYAMAGTEPDGPYSIATLWRFALGTLVHELIANGIRKKFPNYDPADVDSVMDLREIGLPGSGRGDYFFRFVHEGEEIVIANEWKTCSPFKFKKAMGANNNSSKPTGPDFGAMVQGALGAVWAKARQLRIGYIGLEVISPGQAKKLGLKTDVDRFAGEWVYPMSVVESLVENERVRVTETLGHAMPGDVPRVLDDPEYLKGTIVTNPSTGRINTLDDDGTVIDTGTTWMCDYCDFRESCVTDGA